MKFLRLSPVFMDLAQTAVVSGFALVSSVYVTRLLAQGLGLDEFGAYSLARRVIAAVLAFTTLGLTIAVPRYLGFHSSAVEMQKAYILSGIALVLLPMGAFLLISVTFPDIASSVLFGGAGSKTLLYGTLILLVGLTFHMTTYAIFRGRIQMKCANILQIFNVSLLPLTVALLMARSFNASAILTTMGLGIMIITLGPFLWQVIRSWNTSGLKLRKSAAELLRYGVPRVPANIGLALMFTFGPWLAVRLGEVREAGYFVVGQAVLIMLEEIAAPLGLVLLPRLAQLSGKQDRENLQSYVSNLTGFSLHVGIFVSVQLSVFADWITLLWLGEAYRSAIPIMRIILISAGGYIIYVSLRSVIDADEVKAINTRNIWIALAMSLIVALILFAFNPSILALAVGLSTGVAVLGVSTMIFVHRRFALYSQSYRLGLALTLNLAMGLIAYWFKQLVAPSYFALIYTVAMEFIFVMIYSVILKQKDVAWFKAIASRVSFGSRKV